MVLISHKLKEVLAFATRVAVMRKGKKVADDLRPEGTAWGLRLRAVGEKPQAIAAVGVSVWRLRLVAVLLSGALAGLGGAALSCATLDRFEHHMPAALGTAYDPELR